MERAAGCGGLSTQGDESHVWNMMRISVDVYCRTFFLFLQLLSIEEGTRGGRGVLVYD